MPSPRVSLKSFLSTARKALATPPSRASPLTFVVGNESADLDSICSALVLAYLRTYAPRSNSLHIPLSNLQRDDLRLRPELDAVLRHTDATLSDILTLSDLPRGLSPENTRWVLVDHNMLTGDLGQSFGSVVVGCIDHHQDEGAVPSDCGDEPRVIRRCGSCMSLVIEHCRDAWKELSSQQSGVDDIAAAVDSALARVALGPILIDTTNLTSKEKTTETDTVAVEAAEDHMADAKYDRKAFFDEVAEAKADISHLSYRDILRKDYKEFRDGGLVLGMSSVVKAIDDMLRDIGGQDDLLQALVDFGKERNLDIACLMTASSTEGKFQRELLVWALQKDAQAAVKKFVSDRSGDLDLVAWEDGKLDLAQGQNFRKCWWQKDLGQSRKQVAPMMREAMKAAPKS